MRAKTVGEQKNAPGVPESLPSSAIAMGIALVQNGEQGDNAAVAGLAVMLNGFGGAVVVCGADDDEGPIVVGPDELERMAGFLIGIAGQLRLSAAEEFAEARRRPASPFPYPSEEPV